MACAYRDNVGKRERERARRTGRNVVYRKYTMMASRISHRINPSFQCTMCTLRWTSKVENATATVSYAVLQHCHMQFVESAVSFCLAVQVNFRALR